MTTGISRGLSISGRELSLRGFQTKDRNEREKSHSPKWRARHENNSPHADYFHNWRSGDRLAWTQTIISHQAQLPNIVTILHCWEIHTYFTSGAFAQYSHYFILLRNTYLFHIRCICLILSQFHIAKKNTYLIGGWWIWKPPCLVISGTVLMF